MGVRQVTTLELEEAERENLKRALAVLIEWQNEKKTDITLTKSFLEFIENFAFMLK